MFQEPAERTNTENHFWMLVIFGHSDDTALKADVILSWKSLNWLWNTLRQSLKQTEANWKEVLCQQAIFQNYFWKKIDSDNSVAYGIVGWDIWKSTISAHMLKRLCQKMYFHLLQQLDFIVEDSRCWIVLPAVGLYDCYRLVETLSAVPHQGMFLGLLSALHLKQSTTLLWY